MESAKNGWSALVGYSDGNVEYGIDARAEIAPAGVFAFRFVIRGQLSRIRLPSPAASGRTDELWKHTCFEAFVKGPGAAGYHELNFAPSRQWAVYRFDGYRKGMSSPRLDQSPEVSTRRAGDRLELDASLSLDQLTGLSGVRSVQIGLSAVVEEQNGRLSYWALKHAAGKPDFHSPEGFVLELTVPQR